MSTNAQVRTSNRIKYLKKKSESHILAKPADKKK